MDAKGVVVPPGQGSVWNMAPGRSATLKLQSSETADSVMMFEEAASAGTVTNYHLHRDSDEVAYVLSGEVTFKIGDQISVGGPGKCAFIPRGVAHAWKSELIPSKPASPSNRRYAGSPDGVKLNETPQMQRSAFH